MPNSADDELYHRLGRLQLPQIVHGRRAMILFEGPAAAGKKHALRQVAAALDPCHFTVHAVRFDRRQAAEGHWLARFWRSLPCAGDTAIFHRSWYLRVLDDRLAGRVDERTVTRAFDEINEFEAQQRDHGTLIVKLYFHVSAEVQEERLQRRAADPWLSAGRRDAPIRVDDPAYRHVLDELKLHTNTRWSPWQFIDGDDEDEAARTALRAIGDAWAGAMPAEPPRLVSVPTQAA